MSRPSWKDEQRPGDRVGISSLASYLPPQQASLEALERAGQIESRQRLHDFGFRRARVAAGRLSYDLAERAAARVLRRSRLDPESIDVVLYATALPEPARRQRQDRDPSTLFQYPATRLQHRLGLSRANVLGISQAGCVSLLSAIRLARDMILAEPAVHRVLCVSSDVLPAGVKREALYNLISDGAGAALVERHARKNRIVAYAQVTKGFYWNSRTKENEIIASYFPTARFVIQKALEQAKLQISDVRLIIPHNVNRKSWELLLAVVGARRSQFFARNIGLKGHTVAADHVVNMEDAVRRGLVRRGDYLLLFTFGFGAHWACLILQH